MKELTFKEVITNIKEGEEWESDFVVIKKVKSGILINYKGLETNCHEFSDETPYRLKREEYNFAEAFKAYEKGKEIESKKSGYRYKKIENEDMYYSFGCGNWVKIIGELSMKEIRGAWYINDR